MLEKKKADKSLDPDTYVTRKKILEAVQVLKNVTKSKPTQQEKKSLFEEDETDKFVYLQFNLKKIPKNFSTFIHSITLPYHWRHHVHNYETCLIVPDVGEKKTGMVDREQELQQTRDLYQNLLAECGVAELIGEILPMRQLTTEFQLPAVRQKLCAQYDAFLCDRKLMRNKHSFLSRFLGKAFWIDHKKVPILLDLTDHSNLKEQIEQKLNQTSLYVSGKGSTLTVRVGSIRAQDPEQLTANIMTVLAKIHQLYGDNVRDIGIKTEKSMTILFYADFGSANEISNDGGRPKTEKESNFVEEEFDFLPNANVRVFKDGRVRITKRKKEENSMDDDEDDENGEALRTIRSINRAPDEEHWTRRMVLNSGPRKKLKRATMTKRRRASRPAPNPSE